MSRAFQGSFNALGIDAALRLFSKQNTLYVMYLYEQNLIPSLSNKQNTVLTVFPVNVCKDIEQR
jgi:hypothetical protein